MKKTMSMEKENKEERGNIYDRMFKENAQFIFIPLLEMELGLEIKTFKPLQEKMAKTLEREVDFLYQITTQSEEELLLHIEFQTKNDPDMLYRMQEYHGIISRKHRLPIRHVLIYLGKGRMTMKSDLPSSMVFEGFDSINIYEIDTNLLLSNQVPEVVLLALLSNYGPDRHDAIIRLIFQRLKQLIEPKKFPTRYIEQLLLLSKLRKLDSKIIKIIKEMPITYDINQDPIFLQGREEGREEEREQGILGMHELGGSVEKIAQNFKISVEKVEEVLRKHNK